MPYFEVVAEGGKFHGTTYSYRGNSFTEANKEFRRFTNCGRYHFNRIVKRGNIIEIIYEYTKTVLTTETCFRVILRKYTNL